MQTNTISRSRSFWLIIGVALSLVFFSIVILPALAEEKTLEKKTGVHRYK